MGDSGNKALQQLDASERVRVNSEHLLQQVHNKWIGK